VDAERGESFLAWYMRCKKKKLGKEVNNIKIAVVGPFNSGKSTVVSALSEETVTVDKLGTTVSLDYGFLHYNNFVIHLFGSPGQERFKFILEKVTLKGIDGLFIVIDSTVPISFRLVTSYLEDVNYSKIPIIILANKQDLPTALSVQEIRKLINTQCPIFPTVATQKKGLIEALNLMLKLITEMSKLKKR
jgi:hypothetical protein